MCLLLLHVVHTLLQELLKLCPLSEGAEMRVADEARALLLLVQQAAQTRIVTLQMLNQRRRGCEDR
jgi:hypothetical protein